MNRKITTVLLILFMFSITAFSQSLDWAINLGGHTDEYPTDIHQVPGGIILNSIVDGLRKYDNDGNLVWKFTHFKQGYDQIGITSSDVDELGNIYVGLYINNRPEYETEVGGFSFQGGLNLVKIDPKGHILWTRKIGGGNEIVKYHNRKVYLTGNFQERININGEVEFESKKYYDCFSWIYRHGTDLFIARFSDIGVLEKAVQYGNDYHDYASSMEIDAQGNLFFAAMHEQYACVASFSFMLRFDNNLNKVWEKKITTEEREEFLVYPLNLYLSENGKLYLITRNFSAIQNEEFTIPNTDGIWTYNIMEYDSTYGDFLRINSYAKGNWNENFVPPSSAINKMYVQDYKDDLIVFTSANSPLSFINREFIPQDKQENLLLFKVNKKDFSSTYLSHFEATIPDVPYYAAIDNPGRTLVTGDHLYVTAAFQSSPLKMFGKEIPNNSGNNDRDILLAKINLAALGDPEDELDSDRDGVKNYQDYCENTLAGAEVDAHGCSSLQNDLDGDGILNHRDNCSNTREGAIVNLQGCELLLLPVNNFKIFATSESCYGSRDAVVKIEAEDPTYQYYASLDNSQNLLAFTNSLDITQLRAGTYRLCISAEGFPEFQQCFDLIIEQPENLDVFSVVNSFQKMVSLNLKGGEQYTIEHNNQIFTTRESAMSLSLVKGYNKIKISTNKDCQGIYEEVIISGDEMLLYPNPVEEQFNIDFKNVQGDPQSLEILGASGNIIKKIIINDTGRTLTVEAAGLPPGIYFVRVTFNTGLVETVKILKK